MRRLTGAISGILAAWVCCSALAAQSAAFRTGSRVVAGIVTSAASGQPLEDADVTLRDTNGLELVGETGTDSEGRFSFSNLSDGKFILSASHRGYAMTGFEEHDGPLTAIVTGEHLVTTGLILSLPPLGAIFGAVTEDSGDPVPNARLSLYRQSHREGVNRIQRAAVATADTMGNFELPHLEAGNYYLCASGMPWYRPMDRLRKITNGDSVTEQHRSPLDVAYPLTCFPDVVDPAGAETISLHAGDHVEASITLHPVPAVHILFQIPKGDPQSGISMPQLRQNAFGISDFVQARQLFLPQRDNGEQDSMTVDISGIAPGQYSFELPGTDQKTDSWRFGNIDVSSGDLAIDASSLHPMARVSGKIIMADGGDLPSNCIISLVSEQGEAVAGDQVASDGVFHLRRVPPGNYEVMAADSRGNLAVRQLRAKGAKANGQMLKVGVDPVELTVGVFSPVASVTGSVVLDNKPTSGVFVLLVPDGLSAAPQAWQPNQSDSDGSFEFQNVIPGRYTIVAIERGWTLDWRRPEVITPFLPKGAKITVNPDSKKMTLEAALEVQAM